MHKFLALYTNEMIKISRKIVVIIILAIMTIGVIGFGGIMKIQQMSVTRQGGDVENKDWMKEQMKSQLDYLKNELSTIEQKISTATEEEKVQLEIDRATLKQQVELYQMAVDKGIDLGSGGFKATLLNDLMADKTQAAMIESIPVAQRTAEQAEKLALYKQNITQYTSILDSGDFAKYIEIKNKSIDMDTTLIDDEKKLKKDTNLLWLKLDPKGDAGSEGNGNQLTYTLSQIENYRRSLLYGIDYTSQNQFVKPLTPESRQKVENDLAVLMYKAEHKMLDTDFNSSRQIQSTAVTGMLGFGIFMLVCMMLILAGGAVSQEISTGSIKSLIISPTKRYKIFFAKLASLITVGVFSALVLYLVTILMNGIYFGFSSGDSYIFAVNGLALELNFYIYRLAFLAINFIDVLVYMMLAYMLSVITRNTAASVGISIAIYFGGSLANTFISLFAKGEWAMFIPFNNLSLQTRIFADPLTSLSMNFLGTRYAVPSLLFSALYLAVLVICMGYIALDSFNRRDIK